MVGHSFDNKHLFLHLAELHNHLPEACHESSSSFTAQVKRNLIQKVYFEVKPDVCLQNKARFQMITLKGEDMALYGT